MISRLLHLFEAGTRAMYASTRTLFVGLLVFVFPLLFIWVTQLFFTTAHDNINTALKQRVSILHESIVVLVGSQQDFEPAVHVLFTEFTSKYADITKMRLLKETPDGFLVLAASDPKLENTLDESSDTYRTLRLGTAGVDILPVTINGVRTWQVFRSIETEKGQLLLFSEHSLRTIDSVMAARQQNAYLGLSAIFLFLLALAYWVHRQTDWAKRFTKLTAQLAERDLFSNMIAHEFRTPLTAIRGYASLLRESGRVTPNEQSYVDAIHSSSERLVLLVNDFLEVARLQSGKIKLNKAPINLNSLAIKVVAELNATTLRKDLMLTHNLPKQSVTLNTDSNRLAQILTNIISNSVKYTENGQVEVEVTQGKGKTTIKIKDTGSGISAEDQKKLFSPFTRVGNADQSTVTGSGLGMWITKQLVDLLGGTIGVESISGVGTHVVITFKS